VGGAPGDSEDCVPGSVAGGALGGSEGCALAACTSAHRTQKKEKFRNVVFPARFAPLI
jgi:hypothetical protein